MQLILIFTVALFNLFYGAAAFPRLSNLDIFPSNATLEGRQMTITGCQCTSLAPGDCSTCSDVCCPAGDDCGSGPVRMLSCCSGNACTAAASPSSTSSEPTSPTPPTVSSNLPSSTAADAKSTEPTSTTPPTVSSDPPSSTAAVNAKSTPAKGSTTTIIGVSSASVVGIVLLLCAFFQAHNLGYILSSFLFSVFGWWLFGRRRMVFSSDRDLGQLEITTFLTTSPTIDDADDLLAWQVFKIGHSRTSISCLCLRDSGKPRLGFGTVEDVGDSIGIDCFQEAPTEWKGDAFEELGAEVDTPLFKNGSSTLSPDIACGTFVKGKFKPFIRLGKMPLGTEHKAEANLYIHAFVTHGYKDGKYGEGLIRDVRGDVLTEPGTSLMDLKPDTYWHVSKDNGRFTLHIKGRIPSSDGCRRDGM